ncbi:hypothetical protein B0I35DRAFT_441465 [Stachybotrys elegans]|uniref:Uncharacterized protein n=1 Tax=Stachybotrys elegans TaxID=80388 RepID=A0A8K0WLH9_9HYPO|nr:hypothetical protein B0I35DRAFT_441465 [Stachybotrys elegans]
MERPESPESPEEPSKEPPSLASMSINQITRIYCRERLIVNPLYWTSRQLELLQCSFTDPVPAPIPTRFEFTGERAGKRAIATMRYRWDSVGRDWGILDLVQFDGGPLQSERNSLRFRYGRLYKTLQYTTTFRARLEGGEKADSPAIAAYLNHTLFRDYREDKFYPHSHPRRGKNIAFSLYRLRLKKVTPSNCLFEPYVVAIMIAIAQEQQRATLKQQGPQLSDKSTFSAKLLSSSEDKDYLHLYTADFPSSFLDKLKYPSIPPPCPTPPISIQILAIPFKPYKSLRDRILALLLPSRYGEQNGGHDVEKNKVPSESRRLIDQGVDNTTPTAQDSEDSTSTDATMLSSTV